MKRALRVFHRSSAQRHADRAALSAARAGDQFLLVRRDLGSCVVTLAEVTTDGTLAVKLGTEILHFDLDGCSCSLGEAWRLHALTPEALAYQFAVAEEQERVPLVLDLHRRLTALSLAQAQQLSAALTGIEQGANPHSK